MIKIFISKWTKFFNFVDYNNKLNLRWMKKSMIHQMKQTNNYFYSY